MQIDTIGATLVVPRVTMLQAQSGRCFENPYPSQQQRRCERSDIVLSSVFVLHSRGIHNIFRTNTDKRKHQRHVQLLLGQLQNTINTKTYLADLGEILEIPVSENSVIVDVQAGTLPV